MTKFNIDRFHSMCDAAEPSEELVRDYLNEIKSSNKTFTLTSKTEQIAGISKGWHIPDVTDGDGKFVEVKEDFSSKRTGNIAIEKNCVERMMKYCDDNNYRYPFLASVNHKEFSVLFFDCIGLLDTLDDLVKQNKVRLLQGGDRDEWNYIVPLDVAKTICSMYDNKNFPSVAKPVLNGRSVPPLVK